MADPQGLGRRGEDAAAAHLVQRGMTVVARNWRCRHGELDIVAREGATLVFCEVKTRRGLGYGSPLDAITVAKQTRLRTLVGHYLAEVGGHRGPIRIDAVGILWPSGGEALIDHRRGVA